MTTIRQELLRLIALNHAEQWVPHHIAFQQLDSEGIVERLTECLNDADAKVRQLAVVLLDEAGDRAKSALPDLIERLTDEDRLVRIAAALCLMKFRKLVIDAVPHLMPWLRDEHEYVRTLAVVTILNLDPTTTVQMKPHIEAARRSDNSMVRDLIEELE